LIRNIVFDIGWVFVRLNYLPILGHLKAHGAEVGDRDAVMERIGLADHECGRLPGRGLLERLAALARQPVSLEEMHAHWVDMFELEPAATVFIDDRADNIAAARARGWRGIVHGGYHSTLAALRDLEVACGRPDP